MGARPTYTGGLRVRLGPRRLPLLLAADDLLERSIERRWIIAGPGLARGLANALGALGVG